MKKTFMLLCIAAAIIYSYQCNSGAYTANGKQPFSFTIIHDTVDFNGLPALQSFVFGTADSGKLWLMFGGRTNGFHGFGNTQNFPVRKANKFIYVYNTVTHVLDSMSVTLLPAALREQYMSTNMPNRQVDSFLYACGGYGQVHQGQKDSAFITFSTLSRIHVKKMISAVLAHDAAALAASVVYDTNPIAQTTGGEIFKMPDGNFYIVLGHRFTGEYSATTAKQSYLDSVHVFKVDETGNNFRINVNSLQYLSDNKPDSTTQYRRRDLVVAPYALPLGTGYGIGIYGGVFTYTSGCPSCNGGNPFRNPIYIVTGAVPVSTVDTAYTQLSNIYSAPNVTLFDGAANHMYTTIFGGLGDTVLVNGDNASFTKQILTIDRDYNKLKTNSIYNATGMPHYVGAEGIFIRNVNAPAYKNNNLDIIDYQQLGAEGLQLLGYIYGGIRSDSTQWNNADTATINHKLDTLRINITHASDRVYKVYLKKNN